SHCGADVDRCVTRYDRVRRSAAWAPGFHRRGGEMLASVSGLRVGLAVSLTGPLAPMGTAACRGLTLWAEEARVALLVRDDGSERTRACRAVEMFLDEAHVDLLAGPYSSGLTRAVAPLAEARRVVLWHHGGASGHLPLRRHRSVVRVL